MKKLLQSLLLIAVLTITSVGATALQGDESAKGGTIGEETEFNASKKYDPGTGGGTGG